MYPDNRDDLRAWQEWEQKKRQYENESAGCILSTIGTLIAVGAGFHLYDNIATYSASDIVKTGAMALGGLGAVLLSAYLVTKAKQR